MTMDEPPEMTAALAKFPPGIAGPVGARPQTLVKAVGGKQRPPLLVTSRA